MGMPHETHARLHGAEGAQRVGNGEDVAELLIAKGADLDVENRNNNLIPLMITQKTQDAEFAKFLISKGANVDAKNQWGSTLLHYVARAGDTTFGDLLIRNGANINETTQSRWTPLFFAIFARSEIETIEWFISKGADVNAKGYSDQTPLDFAKRMNNRELVELLRKHGAKE